jgi:PTS system mannose-specific IIB component/fructoselysine and glucoselysine-specific PTS system IIB component
MIVLYRVDERLIHGQVVVGWGNQLHPHRFVVVDDDLAQSPWEQELYGLGLPDEVGAVFETVNEARGDLPGWKRASNRIVVLTRDVATMRRLGQGGLLRGEEVNIGGIHYAPGRKAILPYVYLSDQERSEMADLAAEGAIVSARDLPGARRVDVDQLLSA